MAEALLRSQLDLLCVAAGVSSSGSLEGGRPAPPEVVKAMSSRGLDVSGHRSTMLTVEAVVRADLIIGMAREHVREVVLIDPGAWPRTFTLKELVRRGEQVGPRSPGQPAEEWLAKVHAGRDRCDLLGKSPLDDVADPVGGPRRAYDATAAELSSLIERLVDLMWGGA
jgi:protein-tyrosine phosphatase